MKINVGDTISSKLDELRLMENIESTTSTLSGQSKISGYLRKNEIGLVLEIDERNSGQVHILGPNGRGWTYFGFLIKI